MSSLNKSSFSRVFLSYFPSLMLFFSVFNEFDFNYLRIENFSFNFVYILIFYWTLKKSDYLGYVSIFLAGLINDVVIGMPVGISSLCFLLICLITAYLRNITLSPHFINDWISFLFTILLVNSIQFIILDLILLFEVNYIRYLINTGFTFIFYPVFFLIFNFLNQKNIIQLND